MSLLQFFSLLFRAAHKKPVCSYGKACSNNWEGCGKVVQLITVTVLFCIYYLTCLTFSSRIDHLNEFEAIFILNLLFKRFKNIGKLN